MKKLKQKNGITLIALVITIIVLLILAGITIDLTLGKDGIIRRAQEAGKNHTNAANYEKNQLAELTNTLDNIIADIPVENRTDTVPAIDPTVLNLEAGDYIKYDTGKVEVGTNGIITCRVLYPANSEYGLQIISDKNVKQVSLGSRVYSEAVALYNSAIESLNNEAESYINTDYAYDARCVGSAPTTQNGMFINKDKVKFEGTTEYITPGATNYERLEFENASYINSFSRDINYETDKAQIEGAEIWTTGECYWLASRNVSFHSSGYTFAVRNINESGDLYNSGLCSVGSDGSAYGYPREYGLRPCISLKANIIKITGGDGKSETTAYVIGK